MFLFFFKEEIAKTLSFLHNDVKMAHLGISPENIYITPDGKWKFAGLIFATQILSPSLVEVKDLDYQTKESDAFMRTNPNINFSAPEVVNNPPK